MEVGTAVWVKDKHGDQAWVPGTVVEKSEKQPFVVKVEVHEDISEEPLSFTLDSKDGRCHWKAGCLRSHVLEDSFLKIAFSIQVMAIQLPCMPRD